MKSCSTREEKLHVFQIPKWLFGSKKAISGGIQLHCLHQGTITIQEEAEKQGEVRTSVTSFLYIISGKNNCLYETFNSMKGRKKAGAY